MAQAAVIDNQVRYRPGQRRGHVESFFLKANHPTAPRALWLKWTIFVPVGHPEEALSELWAVFFERESGRRVVVKEVHPAAESTLSREGFAVGIGDSRIGPGLTVGSCASGGHRIAWDLAFRCDAPSLRLLPHRFLYTGPWPRAKLVSPYPDARVAGQLEVDGDSYELVDWPGMQGHNWGREHTHHYAWGHCNLFEDSDAVFEGISGNLKLGPFTSPFLSLFCLRYRGERLLFNQLQRAPRHQAEIAGLAWSFQAENADWQLEGTLIARRDETVGLFYENPDRALTCCLNSKLAEAHLSLRKRVGPGWELETHLHSAHGAALEVATRDPCHGVEMFV